MNLVIPQFSAQITQVACRRANLARIHAPCQRTKIVMIIFYSIVIGKVKPRFHVLFEPIQKNGPKGIIKSILPIDPSFKQGSQNQRQYTQGKQMPPSKLQTCQRYVKRFFKGVNHGGTYGLSLFCMTIVLHKVLKNYVFWTDFSKFLGYSAISSTLDKRTSNND